MPSRIFGLKGPVLLNSIGVNSGATWKNSRTLEMARSSLCREKQTDTHPRRLRINTSTLAGSIMEASKFDYLPSNGSVREKELLEG